MAIIMDTGMVIQVERNKLWMNSNLLIGEKENWRRI
jgi:hypothetical protein